MSEASQPVRRPYTVPEAAKYFGFTEAYLRRWCQDGTLISANCIVVKQRNHGRWLIFMPE
jgi:helix-turn-helix protein